MRLPDLRTSFERGVLFTEWRQRQFGAALEQRCGQGYRWDADLERAELQFEGPAGAWVIPAQVVASLAPGPRSLLWAWANPNLTQRANSPLARLPELGRGQGVAAFAEPEVPIATTADEPLEDTLAQAAHEAAAAVISLTRQAPYYSAPVAGGTRVLLLLDGVDLPQLAIAPETATEITDALDTQGVRDQRTAVHGLADLAGWNVAWQPGWHEVALTDLAGHVLQARFDERSRLSEARVTVGG